MAGEGEVEVEGRGYGTCADEVTTLGDEDAAAAKSEKQAVARRVPERRRRGGRARMCCVNRGEAVEHPSRRWRNNDGGEVSALALEHRSAKS